MLVCARIFEIVHGLGPATRHVDVVVRALDITQNDVFVGSRTRDLRALHEPIVGIEGQAQLVADQSRVAHRPTVVADRAPLLAYTYLYTNYNDVSTQRNLYEYF